MVDELGNAESGNIAHFADDGDRISFFFDNPQRSPEDHSRDGWHSVLYLLRRELIETIGYDPNVDSEGHVDAGGARNRLFASLILMFTAFDLLAKFMLGDTGGVGDRFRTFLQSPDGAVMSSSKAQLLWVIRNSLVHAFSLPGGQALASLGLNSVGLAVRREEQLSGWPALVVVEQRGSAAIVYVDGVFRTLVESRRRYQDTLYGSASASARARFVEMFRVYGMIRVIQQGSH